MNDRIEILAPAGSMDSVIAAVRSGADAVYVGAKTFSARAHAQNFDTEALCECVRYCHIRGVRVYLALNTVIFDDEMRDAIALVMDAARADIDAVIVQDMGLASLIKRAVPGMRLHASTQMSVHTPYGAKALWELGFERVVLARELSLDEIRQIHGFVPRIELEVFVHGALCMCMSGQCYYSAMLGGRSANRGMCAQPCRLPISFGGSDHALSLKDNSIIEYIGELWRIGVKSAKIEGRMKRPEYVATAVSACVEQRDSGRVSESTVERLRSVFSRSGFTDGYIAGRRGTEMFGYRQKEDVLCAQPKLLREIRNSYKDERQTVGIRMELTARVGERVILTATDGTRRVEVISQDTAKEARTLPLSEEKAEQSLRKTGGTPYRADAVTLHIDDNVSVPLSALNAYRRDALAQLDKARERVHDYGINDIDPDALRPLGECVDLADRAVVSSLQIPPDMRGFGMIFAQIDAMDTDKTRALLKDGVPLGAEIPRAMFGSEQQVYEKLTELKAAGVTDVLAHNIGAVYMAKELELRVHAGFGLNIANSYSLEFYSEYGAVDAEISPELDEKRIERLARPIPIGIFACGYMPLMITRNAPAGQEKSCKNNTDLQDRRGEKFPTRKCGNAFEIYNCVPVFVPKGTYAFQNRVFNVFHFSVDNSVENTEKTIRNFSKNQGFDRFTRGLYTRGVKNFTI